MITFGGSSVDLYRYGSEHKLSHTIMMEFGLLCCTLCTVYGFYFIGVKTLFKSCALYISKNRRLFEDHLCLLPVKVLDYVNDFSRCNKAK